VGLAAATGRDILSCIFLFANYYSERGWEVKHFWSLSLEEHFYLLWPFLLAFLGNQRAKIAALIGVISVFLWRIWVFSQHFDLVNTNAMARTDLRLDVFLIPCAMAILLRDPAWRRRAERIRPIHCVALVVLLGLMKAYRGTSATFVSFELLFQSCVFPIFIIYTVFHSATFAGRFLEFKPLRWIGGISYSIYLWQQIFVQPSWISSHLHFVPLRLGGLLVMASLSYYLVELSMVRLGRRLGRGDFSPRVKVLVAQPSQTDT
jgi:peptidoglycan/LPS O-acetylase OafA/YrhL